jgi:spore coat polysaccharide biosynthesis protein SpsF
MKGIIAITQARTGSTRLPGKVLKKIGNRTLLQLHVERVLKSKMITELIVATTTNPEDEVIAKLTNSLGLSVYRGSVDDVLDRFYQALQGKDADYVIRLTSDCPLIDPVLIDKIVQYTIDNDLEYCSNTLDPNYPDGQDVEVFKFSVLKRAWEEANLVSEREHVTPFIWKNSSFLGGSLFKSDNFNEGLAYGHLRMTVDDMNDFEVITKIIADVGEEANWLDYAKYLEKNKSIKSINEQSVRNEGYNKSLDNEKKLL